MGERVVDGPVRERGPPVVALQGAGAEQVAGHVEDPVRAVLARVAVGAERPGDAEAVEVLAVDDVAAGADVRRHLEVEVREPEHRPVGIRAAERRAGRSDLGLRVRAAAADGDEGEARGCLRREHKGAVGSDREVLAFGGRFELASRERPFGEPAGGVAAGDGSGGVHAGDRIAVGDERPARVIDGLTCRRQLGHEVEQSACAARLLARGRGRAAGGLAAARDWIGDGQQLAVLVVEHVGAEASRLQVERGGAGGRRRAGGVAASSGRSDVAAAGRDREAMVRERRRGARRQRCGARRRRRGGRKGSRGDDYLRVQVHQVELPPSTVGEP